MAHQVLCLIGSVRKYVKFDYKSWTTDSMGKKGNWLWTYLKAFPNTERVHNMPEYSMKWVHSVKVHIFTYTPDLYPRQCFYGEFNPLSPSMPCLTSEEVLPSSLILSLFVNFYNRQEIVAVFFQPGHWCKTRLSLPTTRKTVQILTFHFSILMSSQNQV